MIPTLAFIACICIGVCIGLLLSLCIVFKQDDDLNGPL